jgi:PAS domain S-box-containing protein
MDLNLPDGNAVEALAGGEGNTIFPILVMTSYGNEATAVQAMKAGALDYIVKSAENFQHMPRTIARALREWEAIAARARAEDALRESERRFETLTRVSPVGVFRTDLDGATTFVNPKWCEIAGIAAEDALGDGWLAAVHPDDRARVKVGWLDCPPQGRALVSEYRFLRADDSEVWVMGQVAPEVDGEGHVTGYVGTLTDITARKHAEEAIERGRAELQAVYDYAPVMMCVLDSERRVLYANRAFVELVGYTDAELREDRACGILGCIHAGDDPMGCGFGPHCAECALRIAMADTFATGRWHRAVEYRTTLMREGQSQEVTLLAATAMIPDAGSPRLLLCLEDLTERRHDQEARERAETALLQAQRVESVGRLAGGVAHDFNNLLQAMMATVQSLRLRSPDVATARASAEIEKHVKRGAALTRQLLLFSRREQPKIEPVDVNELVRESAVLLRRLLPENIGFATEFAPGEPRVDGDRGQLDQVLMNLAVNARDAMPDGGRLLVRAGLRGEDEVFIEVSDSGVGMPASVREKIFDPFFSTKGVGHGTGLGLAVVHGIVTQHGGHIEVESEPGRGGQPRRGCRPRTGWRALPLVVGGSVCLWSRTNRARGKGWPRSSIYWDTSRRRWQRPRRRCACPRSRRLMSSFRISCFPG